MGWNGSPAVLDFSLKIIFIIPVGWHYLIVLL